MDRAGALRRRVAWDSARERELEKQFLQTGLIPTDLGVDFAVAALEIGIGQNGRRAMSRAADIDHVEVVFLDDTIQMHIDEILPRRGAPMTEQHVLHI